MRKCKHRMWREETAQPIRNKSYPLSNISEKWKPPCLKPSECKNVAKTSKMTICSTRNFIREVKSLHYAMVKKDQYRGLSVALIKLSVWPSHISQYMHTIYFFFISLNVVWIFY